MSSNKKRWGIKNIILILAELDGFVEIFEGFEILSS